MLNLVLKDFLIQKKYVATAIILYPLVALLAFNNLPNSILAFGVILIPYILILGAFYADEKSKADVFINSLPVRKSDVVKARYVTLLICILAGIVVMTVYLKLAGVFNLVDSSQAVDIQKVVAAVAMATIIYSIQIPLFFKYSMNKVRIMSFIFIFVCAGLAGTIGEILENPEIVDFLNNMMSLPGVCISLIVLLITALIFLVSLNISVKVYGNKEL